MKLLHTSFQSPFFPPLLCGLIFGLASWLVFYLTDPSADPAVTQRLEKLQALAEQDRSRLESYGWVDRAKGRVHIPIERAMQLEEHTLSSVKPHAAESPTHSEN
jgi:hypothetical protein